MTLKYDLLTLDMTPSGIENVTIELAVLKKKKHFDPKTMFLAPQEVILVQDSSWSFRLKFKKHEQMMFQFFLKAVYGQYLLDLDRATDLPFIIISHLSPSMNNTQKTSKNYQNSLFWPWNMPFWPWRWPIAQVLLEMSLLNSPSSKTPIMTQRTCF